MKVFATTLLTLLLSVGSAGVAYADAASKTAAASKSPDTATTAPAVSNAAQSDGAVKRFDFEDDQVEGDLQRPDGELVTSIPKASQASLIEIRRNFIPEIIKSLEDL